MTLWTIQNIDQYNNLLQEGYISGSSDYIYPLFRDGYKWMIDQMHKRLRNKHNSSSYPIWAWYGLNNHKYNINIIRDLLKLKSCIKDALFLLTNFRKHICINLFHYMHYKQKCFQIKTCLIT